MDWIEFLSDMLGISKDFGIVSIEKIEHPEKIIRLNIKYTATRYKKESVDYRLYDNTPEREWQHLSWFDYKCYIVCSLPRYIDSDGKPKVIEPSFAPKNKGYTHLFSKKTIEVLKQVRVQKTAADILQTTPYIVRSVMEQSVEGAIEKRGLIDNFINVSIDEKSYAQGHEYATILIDSDKEYIVEMHEGRKEKSVRALFYGVSGNETQPQIKRVNIDMWKPYMNVVKEIAPQATMVHDKFHLIKKLSEAIDKTRKQEVKEQPLLKEQKYTVLKNQENRTDKQKLAFETIDAANLKTAQAWHIRENFKTLFNYNNTQDIETLFEHWIENSKQKQLKYVDAIITTFVNHKQGIIDAFKTKTDSGLHENMNGRIQSVIAKARGFLNFERFRINVLFYFGKLNLTPQ